MRVDQDKTGDIKARSISETTDDLLEQIESLLRRQVELANRDKISEIEGVLAETDRLIQEMRRSRSFNEAKLSEKRAVLGDLYGQLCLALMAKRSETKKELIQLRDGKRVMGVYRANV